MDAEGKTLGPAGGRRDNVSGTFFHAIARSLDLPVRHLGFGKRRHAGVAGECGAQHQHGDRGARAFAEPHAEIEQRGKAELFEQEPWPASADLGPPALVERIDAKLGQGRNGGGAHEAVEQRWDALMPRRERGAEDGGKLASAKSRGDAQRIAEFRRDGRAPDRSPPACA